MGRETAARPLVILGSARSDGDTRQAVEVAFAGRRYDLADLNVLSILPYGYASTELADDFPQLVEKMLAARRIVFATPVYWYAMSAQMKIAFDRLTDLVTIDKLSGRALAGRSVWLIASGTDEGLPPGFEVPFERTCSYFDMRYRGAAYRRVPAVAGTDEALAAFGARIVEDA